MICFYLSVMKILREHILFLNRQINQIGEGGVYVFYRKMKKMFWLLFMNIFAPLAVRFEINWPKAYLFIGQKNLKRSKKLNAQKSLNKLELERTFDQAVACFKMVADRAPVQGKIHDWITASRNLGGLYFTQGNMEEINDLFQKEAENLHKMTQESQFDELGMEFLPRYLPVGSIGNYEHLEIYVKAPMLGLCPSRKLILLVEPKAPINNFCYLNYWRKYITIISDPTLVQMLFPFQKRFELPLNLYMSLNGKIYKSFLALGYVRERWIHAGHPPLLRLSEEDYGRGWQCLKSFGLKEGDWFVCLHVRERGWKDNNSSSEDFRNADINTYLLAIKSVTDAGGWVIRMGDPTMRPLPKMPHVIDYAHSNAKSDWMDVFLCASCRFFIGTSSGLFDFAMAFGRPVVATNFLPTCCTYFLSSHDMFIPRLCRSRQKNRFLNFEDLFSPHLGTAAIQFLYDHKGIDVLSNSAEEIKAVVEEMLEKCNGSLANTLEDEDLQRRFRKMTSECGKKYGGEKAVVNARIGRNFLRKYADLLPSKGEASIMVDIR